MNGKNLVTVESSSARFLVSLNCWFGDNNSGTFEAKAFERPAVILSQNEPCAQQNDEEKQVGQSEQSEIAAFFLQQLPRDLAVGDEAGHRSNQSAKTAEICAADETAAELPEHCW